MLFSVNASLSWPQIYIFSFEYQLLSSWFALFVARFYGARVDLLNRMWGLSEGYLGTYWSVPLDLTSCRRFVIEMAKARRCDNEGSPCKRWGLDVSVKSKETFSLTNGKIGIRRTKASVNPHMRIGVGKDLMNDFYVLCMVLLVRGENFC